MNDDRPGLIDNEQEVATESASSSEASSIAEFAKEKQSYASIQNSQSTSASTVDLLASEERQGKGLISTESWYMPIAMQFDTFATSTNNGFMHFFRAQMASGYLTLPYAFMQGGLYVSLAVGPVVAIINIICMLGLVKTSQHLAKKIGRQELDYGHLVKKAIDEGPRPFRRYSKAALYMTNFCIGAYQVGVCSVQASFVAVNIIGLLCWAQFAWVPSLQLTLALIMPILLSLNYIPNLGALAYLSTIGNLIICVGFVFVLQFVVRGGNQINALPASSDVWGVALYIGNAMYTYEGQTVVLPIENKMRFPKDMLGFSGVVVTTISLLAAMFTAIGFYGYAKFGADIKQTLTLNMPQTWPYQTANMALTLAVLLGYGIQLYVPLEMLWPAITRKYLIPYVSPNWHRFCMYSFRHSMVIFSCVIAMLVPKLSSLMTLVGVSVGMIISFILPPALQLLVFWNDWTRRQRWIYGVGNSFIILVATFFMLIGTYASIMDVAKDFGRMTRTSNICETY